MSWRATDRTRVTLAAVARKPRRIRRPAQKRPQRRAVQQLLPAQRLAQALLGLPIKPFAREQYAETVITRCERRLAARIVRCPGFEPDRFAVGLLGGIELRLREQHVAEMIE